MSNNIECAKYFKNQKVYYRCFEELMRKWKSYGKVAGYITLKDTSEEERRAIGGIIGKVFYEKNIKFSFTEFELGLQRTKYAPVDMKEMLESYFGKTLFTNQGEKQKEYERKTEFWENLCESFSVHSCKESVPLAFHWIKGMISEKKYGYQLVVREYGKDAPLAENLVKNIGNALGKLEAMREKESECPLAVFAAEISGNPHYFDRNTTAGQLFVHAISYCESTELPESAYQWRKLLLRVGIVPDNVSSMVHVYGLRLQTKEGWHPAYDTFCSLGEPYVITMENLKKITGAVTAGGRAYVVENEMVFSYLLENVKAENFTLLCTSGQIRTVVLELLPLILETGAVIYYSGDIDPEGIGIADRLWQKFGERVQIWRMSPEDYVKGMSEECIGDGSMSKLKHVQNPLLKVTAEYMQEKGKAAYQENILEDLLEDIKRFS